MNTKPLFTIADIGCYSDSARGVCSGCVIIEMATTHGFTYYEECTRQQESLFDAFEIWQENEDRFVSLYHSEWEDFLISREDYLDLWEMAENYLNTMCDDTVWFGCSEGGDWGLWSVDEEEGNDNE